VANEQGSDAKSQIEKAVAQTQKPDSDKNKKQYGELQLSTSIIKGHNLSRQFRQDTP
jgi:hypothetical protein